MLDPKLRDDPYPSYERLRAQGRIVDTGLAPTTVDHAVCTAVLRSPDFGSGVRSPSNLSPPVRLAMRLAAGGPLDAAEPPSMLAVDPPDHTRYRKLVTRAFSARRIAELRGRVTEVAEELLDGMAAKAAAGEPVDLVADYASLLPATVIAEMLGAPVEMRRQFLEWGAGAALSLDPGLTCRDYRRARARPGGAAGLDGRSPRPCPPFPRRRPAVRAGVRARRGPGVDRRRAAEHRLAGARRGVRDHREPAGQRRRAARGASRPARGAAGGSGVVGDGDGRGAAVRLARAADGPDGAPRHGGGGRAGSRRASSWC